MKIWILFQSYKSKCLNSIFRVWNVAIYALFSGKFWYFGNCAGAKHLTSIMSEPCVRCAFCAVAVQSLFAAPHPPAQSSKPIGNTPQCPSSFSLNLCTFLQLNHLAKNLFLVFVSSDLLVGTNQTLFIFTYSEDFQHNVSKVSLKYKCYHLVQTYPRTKRYLYISSRMLPCEYFVVFLI